MLKTGIEGQDCFTVMPEHTALNAGSGTLEVLASPVLIAHMEKAAWQSIKDELDEGQTTVGTSFELVHTSPTLVGKTIKCESLLRRIDGKSLLFMITAYDETGEIARAKHERCIVSTDKFLEKAALKNNII